MCSHIIHLQIIQIYIYIFVLLHMVINNKILHVFKRIRCVTKPGVCLLKYLLSELVLIQQTNF